MERFINKQTWEFEVSYVADVKDDGDARDVSLEPENVIGVTELFCDGVWDSEDITGQPHPTTNPHILSVIDRIAGMLAAAQNPMTPEAIYDEAHRKIIGSKNPFAAALEMIDQVYSHLQNQYMSKDYREVIALSLIRNIVQIFEAEISKTPTKPLMENGAPTYTDPTTGFITWE